MPTLILKVGEETTIGGERVKVVSCGQHSEGDQPAVKTVTLEVGEPEPNE